MFHAISNQFKSYFGFQFRACPTTVYSPAAAMHIVRGNGKDLHGIATSVVSHADSAHAGTMYDDFFLQLAQRGEAPVPSFKPLRRQTGLFGLLRSHALCGSFCLKGWRHRFGAMVGRIPEDVAVALLELHAPKA